MAWYWTRTLEMKMIHVDPSLLRNMWNVDRQTDDDEIVRDTCCESGIWHTYCMTICAPLVGYMALAICAPLVGYVALAICAPLFGYMALLICAPLFGHMTYIYVWTYRPRYLGIWHWPYVHRIGDMEGILRVVRRFYVVTPAIYVLLLYFLSVHW